MSLIHVNNFSTTLSAGINSSATSMSVVSVSGGPAVGSGANCNFTITDGTNYEIVQATAVSSLTYTIVRAQEGTSAQTWSSGATVMCSSTANSFDRKLDAPSSISNYQIYAGPTTANGLNQQISNGTSGYILTSGGSGALPSFTSLNGLATVNPVSTGAIIYSNGTTWTTLSTSGSTTRYLSNQGTSNAPSWNQVNLTNGVTGTLPAANGGTGITSLGTGVSSALGTAVTGGATPFVVGDEGTFTPTVTCATPGTLSIVYSTQSGIYKRFGNMVVIRIVVVFTPTLGTASGDLIIGSLPFSSGTTGYVGALQGISNITWPSSATMLLPFIVASGTTSKIRLAASNLDSVSSPTYLPITAFTSGVSVGIAYNAYYSVN